MSDRKNSEGYSDPTAYQAMMNLEIEELRFKKLLRSIKDVCDLADFEIEGRVVLIDKRSGPSMEVASPNRVNLPRFCLI